MALPLRSTLAVALCAVALGCQSPPAPKLAASTTVAVTPAGSATPPPAAAIDLAASDAAAPLDKGAVDSDLATDDESAVEALVASDEIKVLLPDTLIHDGGVILYRMLGLAAKRNGCGGPDDPPASWSRTAIEVGQRQLKIRKVPGSPGQARVVVTWQNRGQLSYKDKGVTRKRFVEGDKRTILVQRDNGRWRPVAVTPLDITSVGGHAGLDIGQVRLYHAGDTTPALAFDESDPMIDLADKVPAFHPGEAMRVEVEVADKKGCPLFVFAHMVEGNNRTRERLTDDDGDGVYTGTFYVPALKGLQNLAIDVLEPNVFTAGGVYRSNGLAMDFRVQGSADAGATGAAGANGASH